MSQRLFQTFQPLATIATTPNAVRTLQPLCQQTKATLWVPASLAHIPNTQVYRGSLKDHLHTLWNDHQGLIFCLATGAVVRLIAPLLTDKSQDPAVVVLDEPGQFVISLCSGHLGKADQLTQLLAQQIGATPILTGASNAANLPSIDTLGVPFGWQRGTGDWNAIAGAIARGETVTVHQAAGSELWQGHLPPSHTYQFVTDTEAPQIWISPKVQSADHPSVQWHPRVLWVGMGCERSTSQQLMEQALHQVCEQHQLAWEAIAGVATLDLKADEVGLVDLCQQANWPLECYSPEDLKAVAVPTPSNVVKAEVGTPSVAEAAALKAAQQTTLLVTKQIFKDPAQPGAVTVAIAQAEQEYTERTGQLLLVGTGPGALEQMTPAAKTAITQADVVIGYTLYVDLVRSQFRPGQIIEPSPITQERQRAQRAIDLAQWGLTVAVISSGDAGIYGMAGLVMEALQQNGWDGQTPAVQIFPGISALQAAASQVGTPLMHDFCAISLSDLLTPWPVIEKRLEAAAAADFVMALYNPRSQKRIEHLLKAQQICLQYRDPQTPVAVVRSVYRPDQTTHLGTLAELDTLPVDMLSTVIIGNATTRFHQDWMITPRGYFPPSNSST
ncbi:precorrin-3B C(17)-methyltransferase [Acaryochloris sp. CCMEE 5410]|uniref:precorrin-3B C(17)-methyltransferase n=1 Tax=Acaryochloris sp. CCMEE 5410 TaxID=310037 RepID=UPI0002483AB4|nr:precorrin-3B C(17)-methyltransferase [Acaryochloris sp. CCMEE 5410]